jgi:hypothetical protein
MVKDGNDYLFADIPTIFWTNGRIASVSC